MENPTPHHVVRCASCFQNFDAMEAAFCQCLAAERTLVCPHCNRCFCKASIGYKRQFWTGAPRELSLRKQADHAVPHVPFATPAAATAADAAALKRPLVLLCEDEPGIRMVATKVIEGLGFGVLIARNGSEGLELARSHRPDLVLTDALMPKLDGREMAKQLRADPDLGKVPIVVMTSLYTGVKYRLEAQRHAKVDDYLDKPIDIAQLTTVLTRHLGPSRA
ncbi:MAG: response regulator [Vicinamibacteria bacterium]|nr:response regulator [Vicinamibacteria bacterium]